MDFPTPKNEQELDKIISHMVDERLKHKESLKDTRLRSRSAYPDINNTLLEAEKIAVYIKAYFEAIKLAEDDLL